jgi:hypothetical protein
MERKVTLSRLLVDILVKRGVLTEQEIQEQANKVEEKLKPRNIFDGKELEEVTKALQDLKLPSPTGYAHAMWLHGIRQMAKEFSSDRVYGAVDLRNLISTLLTAGIRDLNIYEKLEAAAQLAEEYG